MSLGEELAPLARELQTLWPQPLAGYHRLELAHGRVILNIGFGDVNALAIQRRGARVTLCCADGQPAQSASGNRQGALYPLLNHRYDALAQFYAIVFP